MQKTLFLFGLFCLINIGQVFGQTRLITTPNISQKAIVGQTIGLTDISLTYHRPAVKGRELMGKIIPYRTPWRAGANDNTVITFSDKVKIEGQELAAGTYGLHLLATENDWTVIFSNNSTSWGSYSYDEKEDALRVTVKAGKSDAFQEFLAFEFSDITPNSALCALVWGNIQVGFTIESNVEEATVAQIRNELRDRAGWSWDGYNEAAAYCLNNNINLEEAMTWATRSVFMNPNGANMMTKAKLTAKIQQPDDEKAQTKIALTTLESDLTTQTITWKEYATAANYAMSVEAWEEAEKWIDESIKRSSNMTNMMAKVKIFETKGDNEKAEKLRKEAIERGTDQELNLYGYQLMWAGKTQEAVAIFEANTEKNGANPNTWDSLGEGYMNNGQKEDAIRALKKCLSLNPPPAIKANTMQLLSKLEAKTEDLKP